MRTYCTGKVRYGAVRYADSGRMLSAKAFATIGAESRFELYAKRLQIDCLCGRRKRAEARGTRGVHPQGILRGGHRSHDSLIGLARAGVSRRRFASTSASAVRSAGADQAYDTSVPAEALAFSF